MNQELENDLVRLSNQLKPGEFREAVIDRTRISSDSFEKLICQVHYIPNSEEQFINTAKSKKVVTLPFTATREDSKEVILRGKIDTLNVRKAKRKGNGFKVLRDFVSNKIKELAATEDDFDKIYYDDKGRTYEIIDGIKTYIDDRGVFYYLKYDMDGNEYAWIKLTDGSEGVFLDQDRTIILVHDRAYRFDGDIHYDQEVNYIKPHR